MILAGSEIPALRVDDDEPGLTHVILAGGPEVSARPDQSDEILAEVAVVILAGAEVPALQAAITTLGVEQVQL